MYLDGIRFCDTRVGNGVPTVSAVLGLWDRRWIGGLGLSCIKIKALDMKKGSSRLLTVIFLNVDPKNIVIFY